MTHHRVRLATVLASMAIALTAGAAVVLAEGADVAISDNRFEPAEVTITAGEPVNWTNGGSATHTVTSDEGSELDSGELGPGEAFGHVFEVAGTFAYHCEIHPTEMKGTVVVKAAAPTPSPAGTPTQAPPEGTLPPNFSPFPTSGPVDTPAPTPEPTTATPAPSPSAATTPGSVSDDRTLPLAVGFALAVGFGVLVAYLLRRGRPAGRS